VFKMEEKNYWLAITNEENYQIIKEKDVYVFNNSNKKYFDAIKVGDFIFMYVIRKKFG